MSGSRPTQRTPGAVKGDSYVRPRSAVASQPRAVQEAGERTSQTLESVGSKNDAQARRCPARDRTRSWLRHLEEIHGGDSQTHGALGEGGDLEVGGRCARRRG